MIVSVPQQRVARWPITTTTFADLTTKEVTGVGWATVDGDSVLQVQTAVNLTAAETDAITRRITTGGDVEETLYTQGAAALDTDRNFRDNTSAQLLTGAQAILDDPTVTQAEAVTYIKQLAQAVKTLTNQTESLARQNIGLIRLAQRLLDAAD